jgi:hypothetical protein
VRSRGARLLAFALALAVVGVGAAFVIHEATRGSAAPLRDCAAALAAAKRQLARADARLARLRREDARLLAAFRVLAAKLEAIEKKHPGNELPPPVYARYRRIQRAADAGYKRYSRFVDRTNVLIVSRNAVARRYNQAAACEPRR